MHRRRFIALLGAAITAARTLRAQQKAMPVIGSLSLYSPPTNPGDLGHGPFHQGLSETGFIEGQNIVTEYRWAEGQYHRLPALAADLVSSNVDLIVTSGGTPAALAAKNATSTIPIVFAGGGDPVGFGLVDGLARPGGNLTGFSNLAGPLVPKRLELLCELIPQATVIALLWNPENVAAGERHIRFMQEAARAKGVQLLVLSARTEGEIDTAFASFSQLQVGGLVVDSDSFFISRRQQLVGLASQYAVPATYEGRMFTAIGGLISYGIDNAAAFRQAGIYAGRILKGERPADLPVQQPATFELVVNLKTAKALGLTVPPSILARADEVIE
ncbi:MAG: ABC transporter substrate-binding protein [Alphaproteobacteria bacterium]|nr:ABC transporter substrate-binding protein [Alphaproteobacteria bacterium]